jgi:hypothetical protein
MGTPVHENFQGAAITAFPGRLENELKLGLNRAKKITSFDEVDDEFLSVWYFGEEPNEDNTKAEARIVLNSLRKHLVCSFEQVIQEVKNPNGSCFMEIGNRDVLFSGGAGWRGMPTGISVDISEVLASGLYWGDRLSPRQAALKKQIISNVKKENEAFQTTLQENLDELMHQLKSEVASSINNDGWEGQLDYLFGEYGDSVLDFLEEYASEELDTMLKS